MRHSPLPSSLGFQFQSVAIQDLAFPDHFTSTLYPDANVSLCDQVQNFGLLEPLPVQRQADHSYHLLAGYAYLPVLRHAGSQAVWCQIVTEEAPPFSFFALQILHGLSTVAASPILQAHLLRQARQTLAEEETLRLLPLMGHKPQRYKAQELLALLNLAPEAILALHQGFLTPKSGKALSRLSFEDQQYLVALILRYRPGGSKQQKLVELLTELSLRHNTSLERLTQSCLNGQQENPPTSRTVSSVASIFA
jgi:ParB family chromosome partitioning protein